jgi:hypothetical protein
MPSTEIIWKEIVTEGQGDVKPVRALTHRGQRIGVLPNLAAKGLTCMI